MNSRLKELRVALHLSQLEFAEKISTTQGHLSDIENNRKKLSDRTIKIICLEFNVSEDWLRHGTGKMFNDLSKQEEVAELVAKAIKNNDEFIINTFIALGRLNPEDWETIKKFVDTIKEG